MSGEELPRRAILALCCLCMSLGSLMTVGQAICLSKMANDLGMAQEAQKGLFLGISFWGLALMTAVSGRLADRLGFRLLLMGSGLLQLAGMLLISSAEQQGVAMAGALLGGLGRGMVTAPLSALLCAIYPEGRTWASSLLHGFFHIGLILTVVLVLLLLHLGWDWRALFRLFAILAVSYGLVALFVRLPGTASLQEEAGHMPLREIARQPAFVLLLVSMFFCGVTEVGVASWLPYFIEQTAGTSQALGAFGLLLFGVVMAAGRFSVSTLVRRLGTRFIFAAGGALCMVSLPLAALPVGTAFTVFWLAALGLGISGIFPAMLGCAGDRFPRGSASMYAVLVCAAILGCVAGPMSIGLAADALGLRPAMGLLAITPLIWMVLMLRLLRD